MQLALLFQRRGRSPTSLRGIEAPNEPSNLKTFLSNHRKRVSLRHNRYSLQIAILYMYHLFYEYRPGTLEHMKTWKEALPGYG